MRQVQPAVGQNFLAGLTGGLQAGQQVRQVNDQNALRGLLSTSDVNDPQVQQQVMALSPDLGMQLQDRSHQRERQAASDQRADAAFGMQQERLEMARAQAQRAVETHAAQMSEMDRQKEAREIDGVLASATAAYQQGPDAFSAFVQSNAPILAEAEIDPSQITHETFPQIAAGLVGARDGLLKGIALAGGMQPQPAKPADEYGRYAQEEQAAGRTPLSRIDYKKAGQKTTQTRVGPDGSVEIVEGFGTASLPKTTEGEKSSAGYLSRMRAAEGILDGIEADGPAVRSITSLLIGGTNFEGALSDEQSKILQAQRDWVRAKLRKESGAVIGADEMAEEVRTYFPLPGEGAEVAAQKRQARKSAERQFEIMSGNAAGQATVDADAPGENRFTGMSDADFGQIDINSLTPAEIDQLFEARSQ